MDKCRVRSVAAFWVTVGVALVTAAVAPAGEAADAGGAAIDIRADSTEFQPGTGVALGRGNVRIVYQDMGTPLSTIRYTLNPEGASAGWTYDHEKTPLKGKYLDLFSPVRNLLTIGHYAIWPGGVPLAATTGFLGAKVVERGRYVNPIYDMVALKKRFFGN